MNEHVALVAGGSSGIGLATARRLKASGLMVVIAGRSAERLDSAQQDFEAKGIQVATVPLNITDDASCAGAVTQVLDRHDRIDVLVNCVGSAPSGGFDAVAPSAWLDSFDGKVIGAVRLMALVVTSMRTNHWGRIVNVAGTAGVEPDPWMAVAGAANAALMAVTKAASLQLAGDGITANAVLPGPTRTGRWVGLVQAHAERTGQSQDAARQDLESKIPDGRPAEATDIAEYIAFLTGDSAGHITGTALAIDGGQTRRV